MKLAYIPDLFERAKRGHERWLDDRAGEVRKEFKQIFGYTPQLGEPENEFSDHPEYWVNGVLFKMLRPGQDLGRRPVLHYLNYRGRWTEVRSAHDFYADYVEGFVAPADDDTILDSE